MTTEKQQSQNDWNEYKRLVLAALDASEKSSSKLVEEVANLKIAIATLQTKASIWGGIGGAVGGVVCSIVVALVLASLRLN